VTGFDGFSGTLGGLSRLSSAQSRSISPENPTGERGAGGRAAEGTGSRAAAGLGVGWKLSPSFKIPAGATLTLADIEGPGVVRSTWFGGTVARDRARENILRIFWDGQDTPSVECPLGDFFAAGWPGFAQLSSLPVSVNPNRGLNCYWPMPFRSRCKITLENRHIQELDTFYQINYELTEVPEDSAYFHAQFRRVNPTPYLEPYTILDGVAGAGHYVGTYLAVGVTNNRWWGEGEVKFYIDGDDEFPTICGTGTEDYSGGSYDWIIDGQYQTYTTPFLGMHQVIRPDGTSHQSQQRFGLYRWHLVDPVRFSNDVRVTVQALGWRNDGRFLPLRCDMASVAYWYQALPTVPFPALGPKDDLEII
jgi:Protein of unknown function (DUF2961)